MGKAADAFRTISEVADWLDVPAHVLRFWESKFTQIKPVKRAGGRRYYRPADMTLLGGIKVLLHDQGMTIKGAQKYLRENGIQQVSYLSPPLDDEAQGEVSGIALDVATGPARPAEVVNFARFGEAEDADDRSEGTPEPEPQGKFWSLETEDALSAETAQDQPPQEPPTEASAAPEFEAATTEQARDADPESEPSPEPDSSTDHEAEPDPAPEATAAPAPETPPIPEPEAVVDAPPQPDLPADPADDAAAAPGLLTALSTLPRPISPELAARLAPLVVALRSHAASHAKDR
jgi:DNA-binding transcriptional MerR regulator